MTTSIVITNPSTDEKPPQIENHHLLRPPPSNIISKTYKPFPKSIIQSIDDERRNSSSYPDTTSKFLNINRSSASTTDDHIHVNYDTSTPALNKKRLLYANRTERSPSDIRINVYPDEDLPDNSVEVPTSIYKSKRRSLDLSAIGIKSPKQNRIDYFRSLLEQRFNHPLHSAFSSSTTLRSIGRRRSTQVFFNRRHAYYLAPNSKWHFIRNHLHDIAMMNESYARMKLIENDLRWRHLHEQIRKQVLDMREMSILRQQVDGILKKSHKTTFDLNSIPVNEVVHVERDGRVYSIGTRDLVLGRLIGDEEIELDTFAQLDARRRFQIKQSLSRKQEGRNRLKKHIAFSFCLCNLSFIALMFAAMFIFAMKTIIELRTIEYL
jgi:hypothetical protein